MYVDSAVRFRDPFFPSHKGCAAPRDYQQAQHHWPMSSSHRDFDQALTPPPEMLGPQQTARSAFHANAKDHGQQHASHLQAQQIYRQPVTSHSTQETSNTDYGRSAVAFGKTRSPARAAPYDATHGSSQQRRGSQHQNAIASNFQIPREVNDSGGSLSELAAQITCLFWFESSELLQQIEDSKILPQLTRPLASDAKPTTGFRKWVTTILSTTCVAQNVVILALLFVYRLKKLNPTVRGKPGSEYRLLTVALMLGNKFLDDNTYTNKTWAEVSGINVAEVHIMEVEFLSNMKYCLFTSDQDWGHWQSLLGKFASFFEQASRPLPPAPILPPASSLHLPHALPSPPASNQASPPFLADMAQTAAALSTAGHHGPTPAPSPLGTFELRNSQQASRKRSLDESVVEPPPKRLANGHHSYTSPNRYSMMPAQPNLGPAPRLTLPSLQPPAGQPALHSHAHLPVHGQQLPPLNVPARASVAMAYSSTSGQSQSSQIVSAGTLHHSYAPSQQASRQQSPYGASAAPSPTSGVQKTAPVLHPPTQISPSYYLQERNSPYRPVHHVSTLLYPPPSAATQARSHNIELKQMQYQPLGKPTQHNGRLPYVGQNLWLDGSHPQEMTPVHQWPNFPPQQQQQTAQFHQR